MNSKSIIDIQRERYSNNFEKHGDSPNGTFQNNQTTQYLRFDYLLKNIKCHFEKGDTIHDVGSGLCDLYQFLQNEGHTTIIYSGTEIVEGMNETAIKKYPNIKLLNQNFLADSNTDKYDFVVLSGTLNLPDNVPRDEWKTFCYDLIRKMFSNATKAISFNFLTSYRTFTDGTPFYLDPKEVFDMCATELSRFVIIDSGYPLYEVTCTVYKKEYFEKVFSHNDFTKYFKN